MKRGRVVLMGGFCVLAIYSAAMGVAVDRLSAAQRVEREAPDEVNAFVGPASLAADTFSPVDPAITRQVLIDVDLPRGEGQDAPEPIAIPTPTAGLAGLALLGILLTRRRGVDADARAM